ncbi:L10-interacting MYB domain-containing protein [Linum perenne]
MKRIVLVYVLDKYLQIMTTATRVTRSGRESRPLQEEDQQHSRAKWTNELTKIVVELMVDEAERGNRTRSSFKKQAWESITQQFSQKTGLKWDEQQLKSKYILMKKQYAVAKPLLEHSDFRFDESTGTVVATNDDAWVEYVKEHPDAEQIKNNGCPFYNQLCLIFSGPISSNDRNSQESSLEHQEDSGVHPHSSVPSHQPLDAIKEDEELSSDSEETEENGDQPCPSTSVRPAAARSRKRGRKGMDDAIAAGMQHMAAASRLYTTVASDVEAKYSIADCIKALDEMQGEMLKLAIEVVYMKASSSFGPYIDSLF